MKFVINYDLINKVKEAKGQFALNKTNKKHIGANIIGCTGLLSFLLLNNFSIVKSLLLSTNITCIVLSFMLAYEQYSKGDINREKAMQTLRTLSEQLKVLHIQTSDILLLDSCQEYVEYEPILKFKIIPWLKQNKCISIIAYDNGEKKEDSIFQEHVLLSKKYVLSHGSPSRVTKLAFNNV